MQINIQSLHFKASEQLETFVQEKAEKLSRHSDKVITCDVILKLDNATDGENKVCEIRLHIPGNDLFAKRQCKTFEEAAAESIDAIHEQLLRRKE